VRNIIDGLGPCVAISGRSLAGVNVALDAGQGAQPMEIGPSLQANRVSTVLLRSPVADWDRRGPRFQSLPGAPGGDPLGRNLVYELNAPAFGVYWKMWGNELPQADSPELSATLKRHPWIAPNRGEYLVP